MIALRTGTIRFRGFTLIEVLLATAIFSIVLVAINVVFFAALHLQQRSTAAVDSFLPLDRALTIMRKDIQNAVPPGGTLSGQFRFGVTGSSVTGSSSTGINLGLNSSAMGNSVLAQNGGLDFCTSTGIMGDYEPWSDIQEVNYQLVEAVDRDKALGKDLVRSANRNLLAYSSQPPETSRLVGNIEKLELFFYDGAQWRDVWDTSSGDTSLPLAVRVRLYLAVDRQTGNQRLEPVEMVVQIQSRSSGTNSTQTAQSGS